MNATQIIAHIDRVPGCRVMECKKLDGDKYNLLIKQSTLGNTRLLLVRLDPNWKRSDPSPVGRHVVRYLPELWKLLGV